MHPSRKERDADNSCDNNWYPPIEKPRRATRGWQFPGRLRTRSLSATRLVRLLVPASFLFAQQSTLEKRESPLIWT
jgi:hypothetical protein